MKRRQAEVTLNNNTMEPTLLGNIKMSGPVYVTTIRDSRVGILYSHNNRKVVRYLDDLRCIYLHDEHNCESNKLARLLKDGEVISMTIKENKL